MMYPNPPDYPRMAYDRDGSIVLIHSPGDNVHITLTENERRMLNQDATRRAIFDTVFHSSGSATLTHFLVVVFPELRTLKGWWLAARGNQSSLGGVDISSDVTSFDGTWTTIRQNASYTLHDESLRSAYLNNVTLEDEQDVKGVRFALSGQGGIYHGVSFDRLHLYGELMVPRLRIWHPTLDQMLPYLNWGDVVEGTAADAQIRVRNASTSHTAEDVIISFEGLDNASPTFVDQHQVSTDGVNFDSSVDIGTLAPEQISNTITVRRQLVPQTALNLWTIRLVAEPTNWVEL